MTTGRRRSGAGTTAGEAGGRGAVLPGGQQPGALRVGTLSFGVGADGDHRNLPPDVLLDAISRGFARGTAALDLILTAGRTLLHAPSARDILDASGGIPVLFEASDHGGRASWFLAHAQRGPVRSILRASQIVHSRNEEHEKPELYRRLARVLAQGKGIIRIRQGPALVLLICGENNLLECCEPMGRRLLRRVAGRADEALQRRLQQPWIALNPAHGPYQRGLTSGFTKVEKFRGVGPTLRRVTNGRLLDDGCREPVALLHCNNFNSDPRTRSLAARLFTGGRARGPVERPHGGRSDDIEWRACLFEITWQPTGLITRP